MARLRSFAQWLARHARLVNRLKISCWTPLIPAAAQELLQLSIHAAGATQAADHRIPLSAPLPAAAAATTATAATAAAAAVKVAAAVGGSQQQQQQQGLRLRSFSTGLPKAADMLAALQVQHLTSVELVFYNATTDSSALSSALARLSSLQQLRLDGMVDPSLGTSLTTLVQLPHLTSLELCGLWDSVPLPEEQRPYRRCSDTPASPLSGALQQLLAQPLPLKSLQLPARLSYRLPVLNMALLTKLTELSTGNCELPEASVLPAQLQRLQFNSWAEAHSLDPLTRLQLKQLQRLSLRVDF
jgi:hypothetical protein